MFNEGLDLPNVDTVLMLRPTESTILWQQQFGRGLRKSESKDHLRVIDYIGNHRSFLVKIRALLEPLLNAGHSDAAIAAALRLLQQGRAELPPGCGVTYSTMPGITREPCGGRTGHGRSSSRHTAI